MRRKCTSRDTMAISGQVERSVIGAILFIALLMWGVHSGQSVAVAPMPKDKTIAELGMLPDMDRDTRVSVAKLEVR